MTMQYTIDDLSKIPQIYLPTLNHAKDEVAFYWDKTGILELYVTNLRTRETKQVSHGECPRAIRAGFVWTRDDENLVFAKDKAGNENHDLVRINIDSKTVDRLTNTPEHQDYPADTSSDGKYIAMPSTRKGQLNLFKLNINTKEAIQLTDHQNPTWGGLSWNPKTEWITYNANETKNLQNTDIWIVKSDGSEKRKIICMEEGSQDIVVEWSNDGKLLAFTTNVGGLDQPGIYDFRNEDIRLLGEAKCEEYASTFTRDGRKLVCLRNHEAAITPIIYDLKTGECEVLDFPKGVVGGYLGFRAELAMHDKYLIGTLSTPTVPSSLVAYNFKTAEIENLIEPRYGSVNPSFFISPQYVRYQSYDGLEIAGVMYKPEYIEEGKKVPALVMIHGGPTAQFFQTFNILGQILASRGFVLLQPNVRGSTGYGKAFQDMNIMDWGGGDLEDVAAGANYLKTLPFVDKKRVGVFGGSYGGYMTFLQVTKKPDLWSAACAWIGISHLKTFYERSQPHFKYFIRMNMGNPDENSELWEDRSALNFAENLRCPILVIHGVNDPRCPVEESRQFRDRLIELGKKSGENFEYIEFGDEGHGAYTDMSMRTRTFKLLVDFFNRILST
ncbi:MAG: S9 family peptidase [Candidatus Bathyarchaeota archaeon]|nr:S9 family peptidase [Candidatus Bathyarchaeota archaeon]MDH5733482.1 S9 family peptidase [Candidatus Bathyarchaeota archaeon]